LATAKVAPFWNGLRGAPVRVNRRNGYLARGFLPAMPGSQSNPPTNESGA
jgi:hypothetical protein